MSEKPSYKEKFTSSRDEDLNQIKGFFDSSRGMWTSAVVLVLLGCAFIVTSFF